MKKAIIVKGRSGSGKTTTLTDFYSWVLATYKPVINHQSTNGDIDADIQVGSLRIRINSSGDEGHHVDQFLKSAVNQNFDIIIGACRGKGSTSHAVRNNLTYPNYVVDYVHTHHVSAVQLSAFLSLKLDELKARITGLQ
jgi:Tfp pilus assembly pilus retraction ATPase PilT